jgi:hypothetical protein
MIQTLGGHVSDRQLVSKLSARAIVAESRKQTLNQLYGFSSSNST